MSWGLMLKKLAARIFFPVPLVIILLIAGIFMLVFSKKRRRRIIGGAMTVLALLIVYLAGIFGGALQGTLENRYPRLDPSLLDVNKRYVICVAGSDFFDDGSGDRANWLPAPAVIRMGEAARIAKDLEARGMDYVVVTSFATDADAADKKTAMEEFYRLYGIPSGKLVLLDRAENTREEVKEFGKHDGIKIMVSNAYHVPRMMVLADKYELDAIPAPGPRLSDWRFSALSLVPSGNGLHAAETAINEYLGMLEYKVF
ncbi:MAG: YdcF family protein [Victivallaceae bacterium]